MKDKMKLTQRTCSTCCSYTGDECLNMVSFIVPGSDSRQPLPNEVCDDHMTHAEDQTETDEIRAAQHLAEATPEFMEATRACFKLKDKLGESHPDVQQGILFAMNLAPQSLKDHLAAADKHNAEVARQVAEATPEFLEAMSASLRLVETLGQDHPETTRALQRAMMLAPESLNAAMSVKAKELDLIPESCGYTADGQPVYGLADIAEKLGMTMAEAHAAMGAMLDDRAALGLPAVLVDPATVHRKH